MGTTADIARLILSLNSADLTGSDEILEGDTDRVWPQVRRLPQ